MAPPTATVTETVSQLSGSNHGLKNGAAQDQPSTSSNGIVSPRFLPPGFTTAKFQDFVTQLQSAIGRENISVIADETPLDDGNYMDKDCLTHDMHFLYEKEEFVGSALAHPRNIADVQSIIKLCNAFAAPVWTYSKGHNIGYGGAAPRVRGSLVLNLGRHMNRILEVNATDCYALLEPGVSYLQLQDYLREHGLADKVWMDCPELGYGSVIGNALDHGVGFTPYGDHWMMHCGMEVVLADGDVVRTGMGAMQSPKGREQAKNGVPPADQDPNECWQLFPYGFGPVNDGIFSQSSNGIITKMGIWLMPAPPGYEPFMITYEKDEDLPQVVDIIRPLRVNMVLQNAAALRHISLDASHYHPRTAYTDKSTDEPLSDEEWDRAAKKVDLGRWTYMGAVYGPAPIREAHFAIIKKEMLKVPF